MKDESEAFEEFKRKFECEELTEEDAETVENSLYEFEKGIYIRVCEKTHFKNKNGTVSSILRLRFSISLIK